MDNDFMDDEGAQHARRRRFQTGLLMILLLFLMDPHTSKQSNNNERTLSTTVGDLAKRMERISSGDTVALMDLSSVEGTWQQIDAKDAQTVVPKMMKTASKGNGSKLRVEPSEKVKQGSAHGKMRCRNVTGNPDVSAVYGELHFGESLFHNSGKDFAVFEGLFFHKFGHMSAVVGVNEEPLEVVWDKTDSGLLHAVVGPNAAMENRLGSGPASAAVNLTTGRGGVDDVVSSVVDSNHEETSEGDRTMDEGNAKRERALNVLRGGGPGGDQQTRLFAGEGRSEEVRSEAGGWASWGPSEGRLAGEGGGVLKVRGRERYAHGWDGEFLGQERGARRDETHLTQGRHWTADVGETQRRHLDADAGSPSPITAAGKAQDVAAEEAVEGAAEAGMAVMTEDGAERLLKFPAMVLPSNAVVGPEQDSGSLPFGLLSRSIEKSNCLFLLTLQTPDNGNGDDGDKGKASDRPHNTFVKTLRGELVGMNCDFSAEIEVKLSEAPRQSRSNYPVAVLFFCLLQTCVLCCRIGFMLARRRYGRNFLVPRRFQPPKFDYHRPIPPELVDQASRETAGGQDSEEGRDLEAGNLLECAICYASVDGALQDYMLTPCDHVFHQACLTRWMSVKMECPTCRRELPPPLE